MKKTKPKATSASSQPPQTDAEALRDIVLWSADRPPWQRQALRQLAQQDQLSADQIDALYQLSVEAQAPNAPLTEADVRSPKSQTSAVVLKSVSKPEDVNALASDQTLSFEKSGLTIVYGDNGAGKSGYARILKHACRARLDPKGPPILPNIYAQAAGTPRAKIAYAVNAQNKQIGWQLNKPSPPELSAISVFDARTATIHVDATNEVAYIPSSLDVLQRLARTADTIRERARQAKLALEAQTPQSLKTPPIDPETVVAKAVRALGPTTDVQPLEATAQLSTQETTSLTDLKRDLTGDPTKAARELRTGACWPCPVRTHHHHSLPEHERREPRRNSKHCSPQRSRRER